MTDWKNDIYIYGRTMDKAKVIFLEQNNQMFATLSPIPGFMQWLLSKLASQSKLAQSSSKSGTDYEEALASALRENLLLPEEEKEIIEATMENDKSIGPMEVLLKLLSSARHEWAKSETLSKMVQPILMRLCARYLLKEKKRGKALDPVTNFHVQNGATAERLNWMADFSEKSLCQSAGIMVNYLYRLDEIEENAQKYFNTGYIKASSYMEGYL